MSHSSCSLTSYYGRASYICSSVEFHMAAVLQLKNDIRISHVSIVYSGAQRRPRIIAARSSKRRRPRIIAGVAIPLPWRAAVAAGHPATRRRVAARDGVRRRRPDLGGRWALSVEISVGSGRWECQLTHLRRRRAVHAAAVRALRAQHRARGSERILPTLCRCSDAGDASEVDTSPASEHRQRTAAWWCRGVATHHAAPGHPLGLPLVVATPAAVRALARVPRAAVCTLPLALRPAANVPLQSVDFS
jgi:hypothetical protein